MWMGMKQKNNLRTKERSRVSPRVNTRKETHMKFYNNGLACKKMKLYFEKPKKNKVINNKQDLIVIKYIF